ncbi:MAG: enoyl-CoA hydratase/isomerase family protein [Bosea sp.]|uniref:enoyl-CoA hydratase/isomerase family protein n=1 Tax=Bosea sp. (in: a-proteobacteria) TaxID=1871050 RepID=UPI001ACCACCF|nr:enoyl-CoA hydratase-related protein [Bosea sp. (in: a-proteobacteria)]MBN9472308.1 enoyl-CoA hydratase/isomerase family protein [Bosea sp. (in: a-proteobacteria)]
MSVQLSQQGDVAILMLSRPEALNALSFAILEEIGAALDKVAGMPVRALIITGAGEKAFCAGADIKELRGRDLVAQKRGAELGQRVFAKLDTLPVASIAAINGYAFGGGLELAMACTFRVALRSAKMGLPEIKLGLVPGYGGTQRLPRLIGQARALDLIMTGRSIGAEEAQTIGLVNRLVEAPILDSALAMAAEFTGYGLPALGFAREAVQRALDLPICEGLKVEADLSTLAYRTQDAEEGMAAFSEKRKPAFRDA